MYTKNTATHEPNKTKEMIKIKFRSSCYGLFKYNKSPKIVYTEPEQNSVNVDPLAVFLIRYFPILWMDVMVEYILVVVFFCKLRHHTRVFIEFSFAKFLS